MPPVLAAIGPIIASIGSAIGGVTAGGLATAAATTAAVAGAASSIVSATRKAPEAPKSPLTPDQDPKVTGAVATERKQLAQKQGYKSTLLTNQLSQYSANPGGKTLLGQ
jgi:hypothetical protein